MPIVSTVSLLFSVKGFVLIGAVKRKKLELVIWWLLAVPLKGATPQPIQSMSSICICIYPFEANVGKYTSNGWYGPNLQVYEAASITYQTLLGIIFFPLQWNGWEYTWICIHIFFREGRKDFVPFLRFWMSTWSFFLLGMECKKRRFFWFRYNPEIHHEVIG